MHTKLVLSVVAIALCALWAYASWDSAQQERFFSAALAEVGVPLESAKTLAEKRVLYAQTLAHNNPLLALPGTDTKRLADNAAHLAALEEHFIEANASSSNVALLRALYPTDFLTKLATLEDARRRFVVSGNANDLAAYESAASAAFSAYQQDAQAFARAFVRAVPAQSARFATDGDIVSRADILASVDTLVAATRDTQVRFAARVRCTNGDISRCIAGDLHMPTIAAVPERTVTTLELAQARTVRNINAQAHEDILTLNGPMYLLPSTTCVANIPGAPLFAFFTPLKDKSYSGPFPIYVGDIRFNDTNTARGGPQFKAFSNALKQRVDYILDSPMVHYSCTSLAHDSGALFAMQATYEFAQSHTLSAYATTTLHTQALRALERPNISIVSQHMVEMYLDTARTLSLPSDLATEMHDLVLAYVFKSQQFNANVGAILNDEESNLTLVRLGWPISVDVPYVFFIRNSVQMLLLADNQSAVGVLPKLFPPNTLPKEKEPFVYYSQLPNTPATHKQLVEDIRFFYMIHIDPHLTGL
jgi:hypothetical protein